MCLVVVKLHSELLMLVILRFYKFHKLLLVFLQDKCMKVGYYCLYNYELSTLGNSLLLSYITTGAFDCCTLVQATNSQPFFIHLPWYVTKIFK